MIMSNQQRQRMEKCMEALATIRKGDKVRLSPECGEYKSDDEVFEVLSDPREMGGTWVFRIEKHGYFFAEFLIKVGDCE